ncbi:MAG TPA: VOC family protein [Candidatus Dormibacteraeota bacterium]|nr:VOC family protein [Candidatus Dormibacteraeota bacterium]
MVSVKRVDHIGVVVADLAQAKRLLGETFGLPLIREQEATDGGLAVAFYRCGEVEIEVMEPKGPEDRATWLGGERWGRIEHIAVEVEDLEGTIKALRALGIGAEPVTQGLLGISARTEPAATLGVVFQLLQKAR